MNHPFAAQDLIPSGFPIVSRELVTQEWCTLHRLIEELSLVQKRLGTPLEKKSDCVEVRQLGHEIRNKLHLVQLWAELGMVARSEVILELNAG